MLFFHFSEFSNYKPEIAAAFSKLIIAPNFKLVKPVCLADNYYQGSPLPRSLEYAINHKLACRGEKTPFDYNTMSFLISDLIYEGWTHYKENWKDYYIIDHCIVNGKPFVFKNTHPTLQELTAFDSSFVEVLSRLSKSKTDKGIAYCLIQNVIAHYLMGPIFDYYFAGDADCLNPFLSGLFWLEAERVYWEWRRSIQKQK